MRGIIEEYMKRIIPITIGASIITLIFCVAFAFADVVVDTIAYEASGESLEAQVLVAQTILTRSKEWHKTPEEVCLQKWQYSCWNEGIRQRQAKRTDRELFKARKAWETARLAINLPKATHYYSGNNTPYWAKKLKFVCAIGNLKFYYEERA